MQSRNERSGARIARLFVKKETLRQLRTLSDDDLRRVAGNGAPAPSHVFEC